MDERLTWEEIKARYPNTWVGLSKVEWKNSANVQSAVVLGTSKTADKFIVRQIAGEDVFTLHTNPDSLCPLGMVGMYLQK